MANTLTFANQTITDANLFGGINYAVDLNAGEEFSIGNTASACVSFDTDMQVPLYSKDNTNGVFTWEQDEVSRGTFYVTEVTKEGGIYTVTAYDGMMLLETSIEALGITTYPATASSLAAAIALYSGYTITGTLNNGSMTCIELDDTMTVRQLLGYIAEISGASVKLNASDELCFMYYADSGIELNASEYKELETADYVCSAIDCVKIVGNDSEVKGTAGSGDNTLFISGNPFADSAADANAQTILSIVGGFTYTPLTCELFNEEGLEVGTGATFGTAYTLIMSINASTEEGVTVSSVGNDSREEFNKTLDLKVYEAMSIAKSASEAVDEVHDYFWTTTTDTGFGSGAHITQKPRSQVLADPTNAGGNLIARSNGIAVRDGLTELATFGTEMVIKTSDGTELAHFGYDLGQSSSGTAISPYYTFGNRRTETTIGGDPATEEYDPTSTYALGDLCIYDDKMRVCISPITTPEAWTSSHWRLAIGNKSLAEGRYTTAAGEASHAEGGYTAALDVAAHAEGIMTRAGYAAHASGVGTQALEYGQTAIGHYNLNDPNHVFEIGNGQNDQYRSNAFAVDWDGYIYPQATKMTDFVVAQGSSGIWTYRKWNSGIAECWGTYTASIAITTSAVGYGGYRSANLSIPTFPLTFISAPSVTATSNTAQGYWVNNINGISTTGGSFYLSSGSSLAAASRSIAFHVMGKWK